MDNKQFNDKLRSLFEEYIADGKDTEFIVMLREFLNSLLAEERAAERAEKNARRKHAQAIKDTMTVDEKIKFVNTPYHELPEELQEGMTKDPYMFNFVRMSKPNIGEQRETFAARLIRYKDKYSLTDESFSKICNEFASKYDLKATNKHKAQRTRVNPRDLASYENYNICPKIDKLTVIAEAMGVGIDYFGGYGPNSRRSSNIVLESKYRKQKDRHKKNDDGDISPVLA